jgi:hypothetical protein
MRDVARNSRQENGKIFWGGRRTKKPADFGGFCVAHHAQAESLCHEA